MVKHIRQIMTEDFRYNLPPTPIGEDNTGYIGVSRGGGNHIRRRHIRVADAHIYQEVAESHNINIYHVKSKDNIADIFTKPLESPEFIKLRNKVMGTKNQKGSDSI